MKIRKISIVTVFLLFIFSLPAFSQYWWFYGKNKVLNYRYNWQYIETPNFNIYHYLTDKVLVKKIANASEQAYNKISNYLNIKIKKRIPLIFYSTHIDFELTNILGYLPPGVVAFAESTSYRVVVQGDMAFNDLVRTITHELGHIYEYEIMGRSYYFKRPPTWVLEGFSEFCTGKWGDFYLMAVKDMVLSERIPQLQENGDLSPNPNSRLVAYDFGHLIYEFLDHKFGRRGLKKFLYSLRGGGSLFRGKRDVLRVFYYTPKMFNYEFGKYARERFKDSITKENPADYSYMIGPDFPFGYSFSHDISPSGEMLAVLTINRRNGTLDIILISMKDGKIIKKITPGFTSKYDYINLKFDPTDGNSFTWNKDSDVVAFFARKAWKNYLVLINILNKKIIKKIRIKDIQDPTSPQYLPGKEVIYFTGQEATKSYIYSIDLADGKPRKLTDGRLFIKAINISPDGEKIVYSAKEGEYLKLYLAPIENPGLAKKITDGDYNDITPSFSRDGKHIYYSSNELDSYNINTINLETKTLGRYTNVRTGNFFPVELPEEKNHVVISSWYGGIFSLYKKDISKPQDQRIISFEEPEKIAVKKEVPEKEETKIIVKGKYKPFKKIYLKSLPPIGISIGTDGGFMGYSYLAMSDLMGDHNIDLLLYSYYGYQSYQLSYLNMRNRWQFYSRLFLFKDVYYPYYTYTRSKTLRQTYGAEAGFFYPFSRAYRAEATVSLLHRNDNYSELYYGVQLPYGQFFDGPASAVRFSLVGETTRFANYGPNRGHTFKVSFEKYIKYSSNFMDAYSIQADFRKYLRLDNYTLLAFRLSGYKSGGPNSMLYWTGGNNTFRSSGYRRLVGNNYFLFNAEFRFPIIHAALTPIGILGPIRGSFFFDLGGVWFNGESFRVFEEGEGLKLRDAVSSYGFGIQFFMFGYPFHFDWVWKTDFTKKRYYGMNFWIGFDF